MKTYNTMYTGLLSGLRAFKDKPVRTHLFCLFAACSLFVSSLQAQVDISGSAELNGTYNDFVSAVAALNAAKAPDQTGKNIAITIQSGVNQTISSSLNMGYKNWNSLTVEGNGNSINFTGGSNLGLSTQNVVFRNLRFNNPGTTVTSGIDICFESCSMENSENSAALLNITKSTGLIVNNCDFIIGGTNGIQLNGTSVANTTIKNSRFTKNQKSYTKSSGFEPIRISYAQNTLIQNNEFKNLLRSEANTNIITVPNVNTKTIIIEGNSFYETSAVEIPSSSTRDWSRYIYVGGGFNGGRNVADLRIKNNYFGSTAAKCQGGMLSLGTTAVSRNFICVETSTQDRFSYNSNTDSIIGNHFRKISMTTTSTRSPNEVEEKRGALTAYYNFYGGYPQIKQNVVDSLFLEGSGNNNVYLVGFGHSGSEPYFEGNTISNLVTSNAANTGAGSISAICVGAINLPDYNNSPRYVTFKDNVITNLRSTSKANGSNSAQHVVGMRFNHYGGDHEGHSLYSGNKISNLNNAAESNQAHFVAGFYSEKYIGTAYRKVYENNEISNLNLSGANASSGIYGIYFMHGKSSYIANNTIRNLNLGSSGMLTAGTVYGIYTPDDSDRNDTIANNRIFHLTGPTTTTKTEGAAVAIRHGGGSSSRIYNNFISDLGVNSEGEDRVTAILNNGAGNFYNNVISICNSTETRAIQENSSKVSAYYHNTVYIHSKGINSYAFYTENRSITATNNIFHNAGQGGGFYSKNAITANSNLYYAPNGTPYSNGGNKTIPQGSYENIEPQYLRPELCNATHISHFKLMKSTAESLPGISGTGVTSDIGGMARNATAPTIGAWEEMLTTRAQRFFVDETATAGQNNGINWENAFLQFSDALEVAGQEGDSIFIAKGTYYPLYLPQTSGTTGERDKTFELKNKVKAYGGYPNEMTGTNADFSLRNLVAYESILSGDIGKTGDRTDNAYHVLLARNISDVTLDGLTIAHAYSDDPSAEAMGTDDASIPRNTGGGILILNSDITLHRLIIKENLSCLGGGIYYTNNKNEGSLVMANTIVSGNTAHGANAIGGGIYLNPGNAEVQFYNSLISGNLADSNNGKGGGVYIKSQKESGSITFNNLTIARNSTSAAGGVCNESGWPAQINNTIIYGNTSGIKGVCNTNHCLIQADSDTYPATMNSDPLFVDLPVLETTATTAGNYHLQTKSPAIYMGSMEFVSPTFNTDLAGNPRSVDGYVDMGAFQQTVGYWVGTVSTDWDDVDNWISQIPGEGEDVYFHPGAQNPLHVSPSTDRTQGSIFGNESSMGLFVSAGAYLKITGMLDGFDETNFTIGSDDTSLNGTFIYPQNSTVHAKVQMYSKAVTEEEYTTTKNFAWQYITCPVSSFPAKNMYGSWVRKYEESYPDNKYWVFLTNSSTLYPFAGYEISRKKSTNPSGITTFFGELVNHDQEVPVTYTETANPFIGKMVMGNPYTAPLDIKTGLTFGNGMYENVYLFHTGSSVQWKEQTGTTGTGAGQYLVIPQRQAGEAGLPKSIPSMQAFVVQVSVWDPSSVTFNYAGVDGENDRPQMRSASSDSEKRYTVVKLLADSIQTDIAWLFIDKNSTHGFDNGYDGKKWVGESNYPSLFSSEEDGNYQVNTIPDIDGTSLSVKAGEGQTNYKLTFNHSGANDEGLYLLDLKTGSSTDISADGSVYEFTADNTQQAEKRFQIVRASTSISGEQAGANRPFDLAYTSRGVALSSHIATQAHVSIFDAAGRKAGETNLDAGETKIISSGLTRGIYILKISGDSGKQPMKFIVD